ncbi:monosaccharide ABC transporter membrane protein (CUT2 family) [Cohnella sp. SGD-V74]|uniref:ABC transporter permease n=1 Tax=unclassified Cohnella TaxID=2636738 RepID=UPI000D4BC1D1|nr:MULTISPECIES: ABC transporter permease [unclassified Cohnella]PRX73201.1 monosaccharide ABC transporter membrane protein (CUT2 family) [Cohnella sp. SGD-V74]
MEVNPKVGESHAASVWRKLQARDLWGQYSIIWVMLGIIAVASLFLGDTFLDAQNFVNILRNNAILGILALGMAFVIISGNIDLSIGSALVAVGAIAIAVTNFFGVQLGPELGWLAISLGILTALICSAFFGVLCGWITTKGRVPSFIVTLGFMSIYRSVSMYYMKGGGFFCDIPAFQKISNSELFGVIPLPIVYFAAVAAVCYYIAKHTRFGRHVYAVGSNEKAARLSGINTDKVKILVFMLMGIMVAIAVIIETSRLNSINATSSGQGYELNAIAAVVIGGVAMTGGRGSIVGAVLGVLLLGIISNILNIAGVDVFLVNAIKGTLVILAVLLQKKQAAR